MSILIANAQNEGLTEVLREEAYYIFRSKTGRAFVSFDSLTIVELQTNIALSEGKPAVSMAVAWILNHGKAYLNNAVELKSARYWVK